MQKKMFILKCLNYIKYSSLLILTFFFTSCATEQNRDPLESYNRAMFKFNDLTYEYALDPVAKQYNIIMPNSLKLGIDNFYNNILEPTRVINDLLQFQLLYALKDTTRFFLNSFFGIFGFIDISEHLDLPRRNQNFGITLAKYGWRYSPYFVTPIFGPSTLGNSIGYFVDSAFNPFNYYHVISNAEYYGIYGTYKFNEGAMYVDTYNSFTQNSIDKYIAVRNSYLQYYDRELAKTLNIKEKSKQDLIKNKVRLKLSRMNSA